ncbi:PAS domain-containing hybrid sensor histidine kinase/response regulator [Geoalkalibacter halelectricus]|uniref:histidine kinase n=1 Tax=Geoalkalibacter halelectricus TaxID=2847045 RepID=A0ABY5ZM34_9BACT|nr:PAS domain-containing hybrid sensor histidine kinase/response regulator [Geoalkalibacter halelectricus]MDO3378005.1 PAS domain S-box protein [Geoalkalibacter halelectricus]UWZ78306.1 PAS domain S-box protein [Geoalkalibacter halelectricus]
MPVDDAQTLKLQAKIRGLEERIRQLEGEKSVAMAELHGLRDPQPLVPVPAPSCESPAQSQSHRHLLTFIEQAPVAMAMFDTQMRYIRASRRWRSDYGLGNRDLEGLSHYEVFPEIGAAWKEAHRQGLAGETIRCAEDRFGRADGSVQWLQWEIQPWHEASGAVGGIIIFTEDITRRKQAEMEVRESETGFRILSEAMPQMVWASHRDGRAYYLNSRWLEYTGQTLEEAEGLGWLKALHPEDVLLAQDRWTEAISTGTPYEAQYRIKGKDGRYRWFLSRGLPKRSAAAEIEQWVGTCTDIGEQKALEEALNSARHAAEEASKAKSEFLATMSHEIRTPMTIFMVAIEQLLRKDQDSESRYLLEVADASAHRLLSLIEDILDLSRIEARRIDMEEVDFDLRACVTATVELFELSAREKGLKLKMDVASEIPAIVMGDPDRLGQVLVNLLGNAIKFTPQGEVHLSVRAQGDFLEFSVADTGIGIPDEKQDLLFQSFSQADSSLTRRYGGSGLGLAISKGLVELMGGTISARSKAGEGSVFMFTVPLRISPKATLAQAEARRASPDGDLTPTILVAEDDPAIRELIQMVMKPRGWQTETAESGREALEKWGHGTFDVILMDIQMPEMNGLEATRMIRAREHGHPQPIRIIGLTAHARREVREEALAAGMDEVLTKPIRIAELYSAIEGNSAD